MKISRYQINVFVINMILVFIMVVLQHAHLKWPFYVNNLSTITSPIPKNFDIFDTIIPKLETKDNNFQLKKDSSYVPNLVQPALAEADYDQARAYIVINYDTGDILAQKNSDQKWPIASLTKVMTSVVAMDLASPNEQFTVSQKAENTIPTKIGVVSGEKMTLYELLQASLMTSANDAIAVINDGINAKYSSNVLVKAMNAKAQFLNLKNTHFTNPQGFDSGSPYSSAEDLAVLSHYALANYPLFDQIVKTDYKFLPANEFHKQFDLYNWNGLLGVYPGVFGVKIGNTGQAKDTTIVASERAGKKVLVVLLGAPDLYSRDLWASELLDTGFGKLGMAPINVTKQDLQQKYSTWKYH